MSDEQPPETTESNVDQGLACPTCGAVVDPRRTTQALSRNSSLLLFCSSGCLRTFLAAERAEKAKPS